MKSKDKTGLIELAKQFLKFGIVGISNTLISLAIYYILVYLGVHYLIANIVAFVISVCNAYFWNCRYVFTEKNTKSYKVLGKTFLAYGSTFVLSTALLFVMVDVLGISYWLAPLINLCFTVPLNFLINKFWAFR